MVEISLDTINGIFDINLYTTGCICFKLYTKR